MPVKQIAGSGMPGKGSARTANVLLHGIGVVSRRRYREDMPRTKSTRARPRRRYWSVDVTHRSNALDLEPGVFTTTDPRKVAASLKRSAEASERRKGSPYQSAMSMLNFYLNRAGKNVTAKRRRVLERAKRELRKLFGRA